MVKHRAIIRGDRIQFIGSKPDLTEAVIADIESLDRVDIDQADAFHPVSQQILQFTGEIQGEEFDWKEEWHKHLTSSEK